MPKEFDMSCRDCNFSAAGKTNSAARSHVAKTGHAVEVYWENGRVIKPV
jgi:hypothetical protein